MVGESTVRAEEAPEVRRKVSCHAAVRRGLWSRSRGMSSCFFFEPSAAEVRILGSVSWRIASRRVGFCKR